MRIAHRYAGHLILFPVHFDFLRNRFLLCGNDRNFLRSQNRRSRSGETLACGTGACATAVACVLNGLTEEEVTVKLLGGELRIRWDREENTVYMTGPAVTVFEGTVELEL